MFYEKHKDLLTPEDKHYYDLYLKQDKEELAQRLLWLHQKYESVKGFSLFLLILLILFTIFLIWYQIHMYDSVSGALEGLGEVCNAYLKTV